MRKWPARLFYGWKMVAVGSWMNATGSAIYHTGFAIFFLPVSRDLGITRAETSLIFSLSRAEGAIEGPIAGWLVDRFGPKVILFGGAVLTGVGYLALSQVNSFLGFLLVYLVVISLSYNGGFMHPVMTTVNNWFIRKRGLAFAITQASHNLGSALGAPALALVVRDYGWRTASVMSGVAIWALVLPASLLLVAAPERMGLRPDGVSPVQTGLPGTHPVQRDYNVREALKSRAFWVLSLATALRVAVMSTLSIHLIPIFVWKEMPEPAAALAYGALAFLGVPTRILIGATGDRLPKNLVVAAGMVVGIIGLLELQFVQSAWTVWVFVAVFAIMEGVIPLNWAMIGDFFGRARFATLRGVMGLIYTWGSAAGPVIAGAVYDRTESYTLVLWASVCLFAAAATVFALLRPPAQAPPPAEPQPVLTREEERHG